MDVSNAGSLAIAACHGTVHVRGVVGFTRWAAVIVVITVTVTVTAIGAYRDARAQAGLHQEAAAPAQPNGGPHDFDFEFGKWRVHHRVKRDGHWTDFEGTCADRGLTDGSAN